MNRLTVGERGGSAGAIGLTVGERGGSAGAIGLTGASTPEEDGRAFAIVLGMVIVALGP
jgi:hypothetical protein